MRTDRGFTLIEVLFYLAIVTLLMSGTLVSAYAIAESAERNRTEALLEHEGMFLLRRIRAVMQDTTILIPIEHSSSSRLALLRTNGSQITFEEKEGFLYADESSRTGILSSFRLKDDIVVIRSGTRSSSIDPQHLSITFTLAALSKGKQIERTFEDTTYLHAP